MATKEPGIGSKLERYEALTDALRVASSVIGDDPASDQALAIIAALRALRGDPVVVHGAQRIDYMERVQQAARAAWMAQYGPGDVGPTKDAVAGVETPLGRLKLITWRRAWNGDRHGERVAWAGEYYLDEQPITVAEIRRAGLAARPTTRNRK